jgi:hypothetical protein
MTGILRSVHKLGDKTHGDDLNNIMDPAGAAQESRAQRKQISALELALAAGPVAAQAEPSVPVMPLRDDAAAVTARKKSAVAQRTRKGRRSTILTSLNDNEGVLGA